ncbi:MAG: type II toxin-antitoxin system VapC family toxin [Pseudomonadota bacterium]
MVIVDTSIWVDHLRKGLPLLEKLLLNAEVVCHSFIIGELACGDIKNRKEFLSLIQTLPMAPIIDLDEFIYFVDQNKLTGRGIGFIDIHLLASARLSETPLWTLDKKLKSVAKELNIAYK